MPKNCKLPYFLIIFVLFSSITFSQGKRIDNLLSIYGQTAYSYLLSANRPGYGVDAFTTEKGKTFISLGVSYGDEIIDVPVSVSYGISNKLELSAGISPYTESYNFLGNKITGVGDSYIGAKYSFGESEHFIYAIQGLVKLPTASSSKELGTGKVDLLFGIAQGFVTGNFGYDLSFEFNLLKRRDFPNSRKYSIIIQRQIDSLKSSYDYQYEPEIIISGGPSYDISNKVSIYAGFSFARNTRLNYNSESIYGGLGFVLSKKTGVSFGGSYGLEEAGTWGISGGLNFLF
jgi:hypothetical protein